MMETVVCTSASERVEDGGICKASESEDILHVQSDESLIILSRKYENLESDIGDGKVPEALNGAIDGESQANKTESTSPKSASPTLIEHAFKVVKNLFSPDKKAKSKDVEDQLKSPMDSPRSTALTSAKSELPKDIGNGFKVGDLINVNQFLMKSSPAVRESLGNADDSFQSAVADLDDDGGINEVRSSGISCYFSTSTGVQGLDVIDSGSDTLSGSDVGHDNTVMKNEATLERPKCSVDGPHFLDDTTNDVYGTPLYQETEMKHPTEIDLEFLTDEHLDDNENMIGDEGRADDAFDRDDMLDVAEMALVRPGSDPAFDPSLRLTRVDSDCLDVGRSSSESRLETSISTTTVILSDTDSEVANMLEDIKENLNGNLTFFDDYDKPRTARKKEFSPLRTKQDTVKSTAERDGPRHEKPVKKSPNALSKDVRKRLNRTDNVGQMNLYNSPKDKGKHHTQSDVIDILCGGVNKLRLSPQSVVDGVDRMNNSPRGGPVRGSASLCSQQSYTVLSTVDNLERPVIGPASEPGDFTGSPSTKSGWNLDGREGGEEFSPNCSLVSTRTQTLIPSSKQSTPVLSGAKVLHHGGDNNTVAASPTDGKKVFTDVRSTPAKMTLEHVESNASFTLPESQLEISPVATVENATFSFPLVAEGDVTQSSQVSVGATEANATYLKSNDLNVTFDRRAESSVRQPELNHTYDKNSETQDIGPTTGTRPKLNETFDKRPTNVLSQTFDKSPDPMSETFDKSPDPMSQTFDLKAPSPPFGEMNQTYEKRPEVNLNSVEMKEVTTEVTTTTTTTATTGSATTSDMAYLTVEPADSSDDKPGESSFISTTSSNASFLGNGNTTVLMNQGAKGETDLPGESSADDQKETETWLDTSSSLSNLAAKDEKLHCDPDLVQLIQQQFSSTDIEKICCVVDGMSDRKVPETPKGPDVTATTTQPAPPNPAVKANDDDDDGKFVVPGKFMNLLSPHSFDFLSSIRGKPTGRDFSRESLYVKFDPLVQAQTGNSLIDFTKEVAADAVTLPPALAATMAEESPKTDSAVEQLLSISPQKKMTVDIVPPLTPLSKNKSADSAEKLRELQNEIYFLKNLYAERERVKKERLEAFETNVARLTGQNCVLEQKLRESSEREICLVKKLQEQSQGLDQLKTIMEEYVRVIAKLTSELESLRRDNEDKTRELAAERDSYLTHLQNTEAAFTDVHVKYEKSKKMIESLKVNEAMYRTTIAEQKEKMDEYAVKAREAQDKACDEFQRLQEEMKATKASHAGEVTRLRALLKKTELKLEAIQESLDQKVKENQQLTAICDELIEGKK